MQSRASISSVHFERWKILTIFFKLLNVLKENNPMKEIQLEPRTSSTIYEPLRSSLRLCKQLQTLAEPRRSCRRPLAFSNLDMGFFLILYFNILSFLLRERHIIITRNISLTCSINQIERIALTEHILKLDCSFYKVLKLSDMFIPKKK